MATIKFEANISKINSWTIIRFPMNESAKLPSRGLAMVNGTINNFRFEAPVEPDGKGSHWLRVDDDMLKVIGTDKNKVVTIEVNPVKEWPEPKVPEEVFNVLSNDPQVWELWIDVTTKARWDWLRWINSTRNPETRKIRIEKTISKLKSGKRNPCCFNRSMCTEPSVSKSGVLIDN